MLAIVNNHPDVNNDTDSCPGAPRTLKIAND
jgi:hypothetical protein